MKLARKTRLMKFNNLYIQTMLCFAGALMVSGCSETPRRDATEAEVRSAATDCGATVRRLDQESDEKRKFELRQLGIPSISVSIDTKSDTEFGTQANCIDQKLWAIWAYSNIYGPDGEDLLVSSGVDRIQ